MYCTLSHFIPKLKQNRFVITISYAGPCQPVSQYKLSLIKFSSMFCLEISVFFKLTTVALVGRDQHNTVDVEECAESGECATIVKRESCSSMKFNHKK